MNWYLIIPCCATVICILSGISFFKYLPVSVRLLVVEAVLSIATDISGTIYFTINSQILNAFVVLDTVLLVFSSYSFIPAKQRKILYPSALILFGLFWVRSILSNGFGYLANFAIVISSFVIIALYLVALYHSELSLKAQRRNAFRTICFALVIYHCGTFTFFCSLHYILNDSVPVYIRSIITVLDTIKFLMIAYAFYMYKRMHTSPKTLRAA